MPAELTVLRVAVGPEKRMKRATFDPRLRGDLLDIKFSAIMTEDGPVYPFELGGGADTPLGGIFVFKTQVCFGLWQFL